MWDIVSRRSQRLLLECQWYYLVLLLTTAGGACYGRFLKAIIMWWNQKLLYSCRYGPSIWIIRQTVKNFVERSWLCYMVDRVGGLDIALKNISSYKGIVNLFNKRIMEVLRIKLVLVYNCWKKNFPSKFRELLNVLSPYNTNYQAGRYSEWQLGWITTERHIQLWRVIGVKLHIFTDLREMRLYS